MNDVDIQPMKVELMSVKDLKERLSRLKELEDKGNGGAAYEEARLLDDELEEYGLRLSYFDNGYCVYVKEEV